MMMLEGETVGQYFTRFSNAASEAGYSKDDSTLADFFFNGYPADWQLQLNTVLAANNLPMNAHNRTIARIAKFAADIFNVNRAPAAAPLGSTQGPKRIVTDNEKNTTYKRPKNGEKSFHCSTHGVNTTHSTKDCTVEEEGNNVITIKSKDIKSTGIIKPSFLGNKNVPSAATTNSNCTCVYCHKTRNQNHWCKEYLQAKKDGKD